MANEISPCLSAHEVLACLDGSLAASRKVQVDQHLDECRLCSAAVEGVAGLEWREGYLRSTDAALARVRARTATAAAAAAAARRPAPRFRYAPQYLTLAATLTLAVAAAVVLNRPGPEEALFRRHFEPYPSTRPVVRGAVTNDASKALALYEARDFRGALGAFENTLRRNPADAVALFYSGLCQLALGQPPEAAVRLEQVLKLGASELREPAEWYRALARLRGKNPAAARSELEGIAARRGFYADEALALLSELDRLEPRS